MWVTHCAVGDHFVDDFFEVVGVDLVLFVKKQLLDVLFGSVEFIAVEQLDKLFGLLVHGNSQVIRS